MKEISPVQVLVTITVIILSVILAISVITKKDTVEYNPAPTPTVMQSPIPVYPNNGKE